MRAWGAGRAMRAWGAGRAMRARVVIAECGICICCKGNKAPSVFGPTALVVSILHLSRNLED